MSRQKQHMDVYLFCMTFQLFYPLHDIIKVLFLKQAKQRTLHLRMLLNNMLFTFTTSPKLFILFRRGCSTQLCWTESSMGAHRLLYNECQNGQVRARCPKPSFISADCVAPAVVCLQFHASTTVAHSCPT